MRYVVGPRFSAVTGRQGTAGPVTRRPVPGTPGPGRTRRASTAPREGTVKVSYVPVGTVPCRQRILEYRMPFMDLRTIPDQRRRTPPRRRSPGAATALAAPQAKTPWHPARRGVFRCPHTERDTSLSRRAVGTWRTSHHCRDLRHNACSAPPVFPLDTAPPTTCRGPMKLRRALVTATATTALAPFALLTAPTAFADTESPAPGTTREASPSDTTTPEESPWSAETPGSVDDDPRRRPPRRPSRSRRRRSPLPGRPARRPPPRPRPHPRPRPPAVRARARPAARPRALRPPTTATPARSARRTTRPCSWPSPVCRASS